MKIFLTIVAVVSLTGNILLMKYTENLEYAYGRKILQCMGVSDD